MSTRAASQRSRHSSVAREPHEQPQPPDPATGQVSGFPGRDVENLRLVGQFGNDGHCDQEHQYRCDPLDHIHELPSRCLSRLAG